MKFNKSTLSRFFIAAVLSFYPLGAVCADNTNAVTPLAATSILSSNATGGSTQISEQKIFLEDVRGEVFTKKKGEDVFSPATQNTKVSLGDSIRTMSGSCRMTLENKTSLELGPNTTLVVNDATVNNILKTRSSLFVLETGKLKATIGKLQKGSRFEVTTPTAVAAVRGTIFYLSAGRQSGKPYSELFVSDSHGGVMFRNLLSRLEVLVRENSGSSSFGDGTTTTPREFSKSEKKKLEESWNQTINTSSAKKGETEEQSSSQSSNQSTTTFDGTTTNNQDDAKDDKKSEQNISSSAAQDAARQAFEREASVEDPETLLLRDRIREELDRMKAEIEFDRTIASLDKAADSQTGKVFTDVHGNRVRVDQYIFQPNAQTVEFLSLTLRSGTGRPDLDGVTSFRMETLFNRAIEGPLKDLNWNEILTPKFTSDFTSFALSDEEFVAYSGSSKPTLYPTQFTVEARNPLNDTIRFVDAFGNPERNPFRSARRDFPYVQRKRSSDTYVSALGAQAIHFSNPIHLSFGWKGKVSSTEEGNPATLARFLSKNHAAGFIDTYLSLKHGLTTVSGVFVPIDDEGQILNGGSIKNFEIRSLRDFVNFKPSLNGGNYNLEVMLTSSEFNGRWIDFVITPEIFTPYRNYSTDQDR